MKNKIIALLALVAVALCHSDAFGQVTVVGAGIGFDKYRDCLQKEDVTV